MNHCRCVAGNRPRHPYLSVHFVRFPGTGFAPKWISRTSRALAWLGLDSRGPSKATTGPRRRWNLEAWGMEGQAELPRKAQRRVTNGAKIRDSEPWGKGACFHCIARVSGSAFGIRHSACGDHCERGKGKREREAKRRETRDAEQRGGFGSNYKRMSCLVLENTNHCFFL